MSDFVNEVNGMSVEKNNYNGNSNKLLPKVIKIIE